MSRRHEERRDVQDGKAFSIEVDPEGRIFGDDGVGSDADFVSS